MSKAARRFSDARRSPAGPTAPDPNLPLDPEFLPPLKPSRRMFLVGAGLVAVWLGTLLTLYFTTILPTRTTTGGSPNVPAAAAPENPSTLPAGTVAR